MDNNNDDYTGIDCGASKVLVQSAKIDKKLMKISPVGTSSETLYSDHPDWNHNFKPISLTKQKKDYQKKTIICSNTEKRQGDVICDILISILSKFSIERIGVCFPGVKNKTGVAIMANGPRIPEFKKKISKVDNIFNDSDCCIIGEWKSTIGKMQNIKNGIYIGGGTGIADGLICDNKLIDFNEVKILKRSWELKAPGGLSVESMLSPKGIISNYNKSRNSNYTKLSSIENDNDLRLLLKKASKMFSLLIKNRVRYFDSKGKTIEKIVIGQRLGQFFKKSDTSLIKIVQDRTNIPIVLSDDRRTAALGAAWKRAC